MSENSRMGRREWIKLGGIGSALAVLGGGKAKASEALPVRGIVFMVSDGMSAGVLSMAEKFSQITRGKSSRWWELLSDPAAVSGLMETSSANSYVTDSAAASSAWGGGSKVNNGSINIRPDGAEQEPIMRRFKKNGCRTGLVSTASITHATPAGFAAVTKNRDDEHLIAPQYLGVVDILLGGGAKFFDDELTEFEKVGYEILNNRESLAKSSAQRVLGLFSESHMPYEIDRISDDELAAKVPSLAEMSELALKNFLAQPEKFLLQIEGARIDHAAHANDIGALLSDQLAFDDAVAKVLELVADRQDILIIITSDHGNANPGLNGTGSEYKDSNQAFQSITRRRASHEKLLSMWEASAEKSPKTLNALVAKELGFSLSHSESLALMASLNQKPFVEWSEQLQSPVGLLGQMAGNHTGIGWTGTSHTSDPTILTAIGPEAQRFSGLVVNTEIHRHLIEILG
jgi:alkaline phosphatase